MHQCPGLLPLVQSGDFCPYLPILIPGCFRHTRTAPPISPNASPITTRRCTRISGSTALIDDLCIACIGSPTPEHTVSLPVIFLRSPVNLPPSHFHYRIFSPAPDHSPPLKPSVLHLAPLEFELHTHLPGNSHKGPSPWHILPTHSPDTSNRPLPSSW